MKVVVLEVSNYSCSRDADWVFKNFKRYTHTSGSCVNLDYVTFDRGRTRTTAKVSQGYILLNPKFKLLSDF